MKEIGILISQLSGFSSPSLYLEQYETDGNAINFLISKAWKDIKDSYVVDLGAGTGFISFACALVGAKFVLGVEIDKKALMIALENLEKLREYDIHVSFVCADVRYFFAKRKFDVCVMNPPFGIQKKNADRIFLKKAFELADVVWTFLSRDSEPFVSSFSTENGFKISANFKTKIHIKQKFRFHRKKVEFLEVDLYRLERVFGNEVFCR